MQATFAEMKKYNIVKAVVSNHYQAVLRWQAALRLTESFLPTALMTPPRRTWRSFAENMPPVG